MAPKFEYSAEQMHNVIEAVRSRKLNMSQAAKKYNVTLTTLPGKICGKTQEQGWHFTRKDPMFTLRVKYVKFEM